MERKPVSSSNIVSVGYDPDNRVMEIEFKGGGVYQYDAVSAEQHEALVGADSVGSHFHRNIRPRFPGRRIPKREGEGGAA